MNAEMLSNVVDVDLIRDGVKYSLKVGRREREGERNEARTEIKRMFPSHLSRCPGSSPRSMLSQ